MGGVSKDRTAHGWFFRSLLEHNPTHPNSRVCLWLYADSITAPERRPLSSAKPTFVSALRFQRIKFQTDTLPMPATTFPNP